jgi:hypothetical protein
MASGPKAKLTASRIERSEDDLKSPEWHYKILKERRKRVTEGKARFTDWETAKKKLLFLVQKRPKHR